MATVQEVYRAEQHLFGSVPAEGSTGSCPICLGPRNLTFSRCVSCSKLARSLPPRLMGTAVPASTAFSPSPWYTRLWTYKRGNPEYASTVRCLLWSFVIKHLDEIRSLLGGTITVAAVVPSTQSTSLASQPLFSAVSGVRGVPFPIISPLRHRLSEQKERHRYNPELFEPANDMVDNQRVLLFEDCWVSGATSLSAAGQLLQLGAESVVIISAAKMVDVAYWDANHPYLAAARDPHDLSSWPRI